MFSNKVESYKMTNHHQNHPTKVKAWGYHSTTWDCSVVPVLLLGTLLSRLTSWVLKIKDLTSNIIQLKLFGKSNSLSLDTVVLIVRKTLNLRVRIVRSYRAILSREDKKRIKSKNSSCWTMSYWSKKEQIWSPLIWSRWNHVYVTLISHLKIAKIAMTILMNKGSRNCL